MCIRFKAIFGKSGELQFKEVIVEGNKRVFMFRLKVIFLLNLIKSCYRAEMPSYTNVLSHTCINELLHQTNQLLGFLQCNLRGCSRALKEHSYKQMIQYTGQLFGICTEKSHPPVEINEHQVSRFEGPWHRNHQDSISLMLVFPSSLKKYSRLSSFYFVR